MEDLTIIFLTANKVPKDWAKYHRKVISEAIGDTPLISISRKPIDWGTNLLDTEPYGISNIYFQILRGAKVATTEFIAIVEDDTLYPKEHFSKYRPPSNMFGYNRNRFGLLNWGNPTYFWKDRISNSTLIASRKLIIEALEERFSKYPNGTPIRYTGELGRRNIEGKLGITRREIVWFSTDISVVRIDHENGHDVLGKTHRKKRDILRCYDIPQWGKAEDFIKRYK